MSHCLGGALCSKHAALYMLDPNGSAYKHSYCNIMLIKLPRQIAMAVLVASYLVSFLSSTICGLGVLRRPCLEPDRAHNPLLLSWPTNVHTPDLGKREVLFR